MDVAAQAFRSLVSHESVRCLQCGWIYSKPVFGGTAAQNPGCSMCSYVGWVRVEPRPRRAFLGAAPAPKTLRAAGS